MEKGEKAGFSLWLWGETSFQKLFHQKEEKIIVTKETPTRDPSTKKKEKREAVPLSNTARRKKGHIHLLNLEKGEGVELS